MSAWNAVVIDDDPDVRDLVELVLARVGFSVRTAADGPAGLEAVRETDPLLTTCDVGLPGMSGLEVARRIREVSDTHLILISGHGEEADLREGRAAGADDYIVKPFGPRDLRMRFEAVLAQRQDGAGTS